MYASGDSNSFSGFLRAFVNHRWKVALTVLATLGVTAAAIVTVPREYASEAKLFVRLGRETVSLDPTATTGSTISVYESRENEINSVRDMLQSRLILEQTVDRLGPEVVLGDAPLSSAIREDSPIKKSPNEAPSTSGPESEDPATFREVALIDVPVDVLPPRAESLNEPAIVEMSDSARQEAIRFLEENIDVSSSRKSSVISVSSRASSPLLAQRILQEYLLVYEKLHTNVNRTNGGKEFFESQASFAQQKLDESLEKLRSTKDELGINTVAAAQENLKEQANAVETARLKTERELQSAQATILAQQTLLKDLPARMVTQELDGLPNVAADTMRQTMFELQVRERELLSKMTASHPSVTAIRQQIAESQEVLDQQQPRRMQTTSAINPAVRETQINLAIEKARVQALNAELESLKKQQAELNDKLVALNKAEIYIKHLERESEVAEANHRQYVEHLEQARINDALREEQITNINFVQAPSYVPKSVGPSRLLMLIAGLIAALAGSFLVAVSADALSRRSPEATASPVRQASSSTDVAPSRGVLAATSQGSAS